MVGLASVGTSGVDRKFWQDLPIKLVRAFRWADRRERNALCATR